MMKQFPVLWALLLSALLIACGGDSAPAPPAVEEAAANPPTAAPVEAAPAAGPVDLASLPAGVTADGAFYLGSPDAPVTVSDYSNFL